MRRIPAVRTLRCDLVHISGKNCHDLAAAIKNNQAALRTYSGKNTSLVTDSRGKSPANPRWAGFAPDAPWAETMCAVINRYLHSAMKRHHGLRIATQALDFVAREG